MQIISATNRSVNDIHFHLWEDKQGVHKSACETVYRVEVMKRVGMRFGAHRFGLRFNQVALQAQRY
jgi:hypothetical protein